MGQKTSPIGFRTGITLGWQSTWYAPKENYGVFLVEDARIRDYVDRKFNRQPPYAAVSKVEIARTRNDVNVALHTARPGMVIGPRGAEVDRLSEEIEQLVGHKVNVNVIEIKEPALDAKLVAEMIAEQLKKRTSFRRVMKQQCEMAMEAGARGVKIICAGRLAGSEMARTETQKLGSIPLQTLDANVDYGLATAKTTYGTVGVKVWIYRGNFGQEVEVKQRPRRGRKRTASGAGRARVRSTGAARSTAKPANRDEKSVSDENLTPAYKPGADQTETPPSQTSEPANKQD